MPTVVLAYLVLAWCAAWWVCRRPGFGPPAFALAFPAFLLVACLGLTWLFFFSSLMRV